MTPLSPPLGPRPRPLFGPPGITPGLPTVPGGVIVPEPAWLPRPDPQEPPPMPKPEGDPVPTPNPMPRPVPHYPVPNA